MPQESSQNEKQPSNKKQLVTALQGIRNNSTIRMQKSSARSIFYELNYPNYSKVSAHELNVFLIKATYQYWGEWCAPTDAILSDFGLLRGYSWNELINGKTNNQTNRRIKYIKESSIDINLISEESAETEKKKYSKAEDRLRKYQDGIIAELADFLLESNDRVNELLEDSQKYLSTLEKDHHISVLLCSYYIPDPAYILKDDPRIAELPTAISTPKNGNSDSSDNVFSRGLGYRTVRSGRYFEVDNVVIHNLVLQNIEKPNCSQKNSPIGQTRNKAATTMVSLCICIAMSIFFCQHIGNPFNVSNIDENFVNQNNIPSAELPIPLNGACKLSAYSESNRDNSIGYAIMEHPELINLSQEGWITFKDQDDASIGKSAQILVFVNNIVCQEFIIVATEPQDTGDAILGSDLDDYAPSFSIEQKVRVIGGVKEWTDYVNAKVGDTVEFQMEYKNITNGESQDNVSIRDILPSNLEYIPNTTKLWNEFYDGGLVSPDTSLFGNGINIGGYNPGANAYVRFRAKVVDQNLGCGSNTLVNWIQGGVGKVTIQDYASVIVTKEA